MSTHWWVRYACVSLFCLSCQAKEGMSILFGGDVMLDRGIRAQIHSRGVGYLTEGISSTFKSVDYTIVNLECPATNIQAPLSKKFVFRADPEWLADLRHEGVTHCIVANNHSYDQGRDGLISTEENLVNANLASIGYGTNQQSACEPVLLQRNGVSVAVFASVTLPLESWMYLEDLPGMCQATIDDLVVAIASYKKDHPETFVIVTLHWGIEYQPHPTRVQRDQARDLIKAGADAIVGHHPHVVQSYEILDGKPVFYSIGNLIFDNPNPLTHDGILVRLNFKKDTSDFEIIPYHTSDNKPLLMTGESREDFLLKHQPVQ